MNLYIKQKLFSFADRFAIYNALGEPVYQAEGEIFSLGKRLHIYDLQKRELALIHQKLFSLLPRYFISRDGRETAEVVKHFTLFQQRYSVNGYGWSVEGDVFAHSYEIRSGERRVAAISKKWLCWGDTYEIAVEPWVDPVDAVAVVLVIDACLEAAESSSPS